MQKNEVYMRYAVISDIHANVWALEAVLNDIERHGVDAILQLGDVLYGPLAPQATYACLQAASIPVLHIKGNQDDEIVQAAITGASQATMAYVLDDLSAEALAWLQALPDICVPQAEVFCCHGTPARNTEYWLEDVSAGFPVVASDASVVSKLSGQTAALLLCGHTHTPRQVALSTGQTVFNPGSVGLPAYQDEWPVPHRMQTHTPAAAYGLLDVQSSNHWQWQQCWSNYPHQAAAAQAHKLGRSDWVHALLTGRTNSI